MVVTLDRGVEGSTGPEDGGESPAVGAYLDSVEDMGGAGAAGGV